LPRLRKSRSYGGPLPASTPRCVRSVHPDGDRNDGAVASPRNDDQRERRTGRCTRRPLPVRPGGARSQPWARHVDRVSMTGRQPRCCSVTKRVTTWMMWPPLTATAVGHRRSRSHLISDARARMNAGLIACGVSQVLIAKLAPGMGPQVWLPAAGRRTSSAVYSKNSWVRGERPSQPARPGSCCQPDWMAL
jgi:hypothetical protein